MWIDTTAALEQVCEDLRQAPYITLDTEFVRVKSYLPRLCLLQLGTGGDGVVIDCLAERLSLEPVRTLLLETEMPKVIHAASQDFEIFQEMFGAVPTPVFDTQVAAAFLGMGDQIGYANLIHHLLRLEVDKSSQMTDWSLRPLTKRQIEYALADVTHLAHAYEALVKRLKEKGRDKWLEPALRKLEDSSRYVIEPREAYKRIKIRRPKRKQLAVLREVAAWREQRARERDLPRGWILKDDSLVEIAMNPPRHEGDLRRVRNMNLKTREQHELLSAVKRALQLPEEKWPELPPRKTGPRPDDTLVALLQALLKLRCEAFEVAPRLVATKDDLDALVAGKPPAALLEGWRHEVFGSVANDLLNGSLGLTGDGSGRVRVLESK